MKKISSESEAVHPVVQNFVTAKNKILAFLQDKSMKKQGYLNNFDNKS